MEAILPADLQPVGPYSPAVRVGPWVFISGQIALKSDGTLERGTLKAEAEQVLENLQKVLIAAGLSSKDLVKVTIFLTDIAFFGVVNEVYARFLGEGPYPARETVAVAALPKGARIEISAIAYARDA